jgi:hypothetical protein
VVWEFVCVNVHSVPVLDSPKARIRMGFSRGCRGMTGYGLGRGTSLLLILIFILASAMIGVSEPWPCKVSGHIYIVCDLSVRPRFLSRLD